MKEGLEQVMRKLEECKGDPAFQGFNKRMQFVFPDIHFTSSLRIADGTVSEVKNSVFSKPDLVISMASDTFLALQRKRLTGRTALAQGKIRLTGKVSDLLLLETWLDNIAREVLQVLPRMIQSNDV